MFNTLQKHNTMKRLLTIGLMLVSAFALTNCAEEITAPVQDDITVDGNIENITPPEEEVNIPFEVFATVGGEADTKTVNWGNATYWKDKDQISVFHGTGENYTHNSIFELIDTSTGKFAGALKNTLNEKNDWYFLYPYSSSATTLTVSGVQIGAQTINQTLISDIDENIVLSANSKSHICGNLSPMLGRITNLPRNEQPEIEMEHLAAIVAIKVVNDGFGGDIMIKDVEFSVPDIYKTDNNGKVVTDANGNPTKLQNAFPIVGEFQVDMASGQCTPVAEKSYASTKFELPSSVTLAKDQSMTFYLPVMPFSATKTISIKVNSSERAITKAVNIESGKVTTFNVPINALTHEIVSDAFTITSIGRQTKNDNSHLTGNENSRVISTSVAPKDVVINGQIVKAYILSGENNSITITGFFKDLINALPIGFYVSTWNNEPAVMTVNNIKVYLPEYSKDTGWTSTTVDYTSFNKRNDPLELTRETLMSFGEGVESKITFSNISTNGIFENDNIVVLNDDFAHKEINQTNISNFLKTFSVKENNVTKTATFEGLKQIAEIPDADMPENAVSGHLSGLKGWPSETLKTKYPDAVETIEAILGKLNGNTAVSIVTALLQMHELNIMYWMRDAKVSVELVTMSDGPTIVFWGLDAFTAEDKATENQPE